MTASNTTSESATAVVIGAGPAGLMAAEQLNNAGIQVDIYDAMPSVGRKFLRAGIGGLNLTHAEDHRDFVSRYGKQADTVEQWLQAFDASALREWAARLGIETFVGSSGRVFPTAMKAAPLLRAWLKRLRKNGSQIHLRHRWLGWDTKGDLLIENREQQQFSISPKVVIFAMGGASWSKLGSDGQWQATFEQNAIECQPFLASNCGFNADWRTPFKQDQQGQPLKSIALAYSDIHNQRWYKKGEAMISKHGIEGSLVYAASSGIRDQIHARGFCDIHWDLLPDKSLEQLTKAASQKRPKDSLSSFLRRSFKLDASKQALLNQLTSKEQVRDISKLPHLVKNLPQRLESTRPLDEAISTAGGVSMAALTPALMLKNKPGYYCVGEMLDWEAPTGGYLLTACFASGLVAGQDAAKLLKQA